MHQACIGTIDSEVDTRVPCAQNEDIALKTPLRRKQPQHHIKRENISLQLIRFRKRMSSHSPIRTHAAQVLGSSWPVHANTNKLRNICHKSKFFVLTTMSLMFRPSYRACLGRHGQWDQDNGCTFHACKGFEGDRGFQVPVSFSCVPSRSSYEISANFFATEANPPQPPLNDVAVLPLHFKLLASSTNSFL